MIPLNSYALSVHTCINLVRRMCRTTQNDGAGRFVAAPKVVDISDNTSDLLTKPLLGASHWIQPHGGRIMWAALLTVAALSLLIFSALAAIATYLYFFGSGDTARKGFPSVAPTRQYRSTWMSTIFDFQRVPCANQNSPTGLSKPARERSRFGGQKVSIISAIAMARRPRSNATATMKCD